MVLATASLASAGPARFDQMITSAPPARGAFPLVSQERLTPLWYDAREFPGVTRAIGDLQADIERVTGRRPVSGVERPPQKEVVVIGTLGRSAALDDLIDAGKLDAGALAGKWESFVITHRHQAVRGRR
jgi:hypothetical protein